MLSLKPLQFDCNEAFAKKRTLLFEYLYRILVSPSHTKVSRFRLVFTTARVEPLTM